MNISFLSLAVSLLKQSGGLVCGVPFKDESSPLAQNVRLTQVWMESVRDTDTTEESPSVDSRIPDISDAMGEATEETAEYEWFYRNWEAQFDLCVAIVNARNGYLSESLAMEEIVHYHRARLNAYANLVRDIK